MRSESTHKSGKEVARGEKAGHRAKAEASAVVEEARHVLKLRDAVLAIPTVL
jgi:hypothetical protein